MLEAGGSLDSLRDSNARSSRDGQPGRINLSSEKSAGRFGVVRGRVGINYIALASPAIKIEHMIQIKVSTDREVRSASIYLRLQASKAPAATNRPIRRMPGGGCLCQKATIDKVTRSTRPAKPSIGGSI